MRKLDWSARGRARVYALTVLGTAVCIAVAFVVDSFSFETWTWRWGSDPHNNVIIPLLLAPLFFYLLLNKMRQLSIAHHELAHLAATDSLTSLLNRRAFTEVVEGYIQKMAASSKRQTDALLVIDVDHFKAINDHFGHDIGDEALKQIADAICAGLKEPDLAGRLGGEEFGVFLTTKTPERVAATAEQMRLCVRDIAFAPDGSNHRLTISIGGVIFDDCPTFQELYRQADEQLYFAKRSGRDRVKLSSRHPASRPA
ncbi:GGDEF domain-containing protein [Roseibium sp. Sym1]|uniref:GGDEF domain-containing protein n=1 Tax=Roseibium sp. Sym1 TaxID=3016006 RepID=UPI0022B5A701|nr:GGDEF domain-containing protein [Roseibium sp. Sym1]